MRGLETGYFKDVFIKDENAYLLITKKYSKFAPHRGQKGGQSLTKIFTSVLMTQIKLGNQHFK